MLPTWHWWKSRRRWRTTNFTVSSKTSAPPSIVLWSKQTHAVVLFLNNYREVRRFQQTGLGIWLKAALWQQGRGGGGERDSIQHLQKESRYKPAWLVIWVRGHTHKGLFSAIFVNIRQPSAQSWDSREQVSFLVANDFNKLLPQSESIPPPLSYPSKAYSRCRHHLCLFNSKSPILHTVHYLL